MIKKIVSRLWSINYSDYWDEFAQADPYSVNQPPKPGSNTFPKKFIFEWKVGKDKVGDCVNPWGGSEIIIRKKLGLDIAQKFEGIKIIPAEALGAPRKKGAHKKIADPIEFVGLRPTHWVSYDEKLSTVEMRERFSGIMLPTIIGAQVMEPDYKAYPVTRVPIESPRIQDKGLFVYANDVAGFEIFRLMQFPGMLACTDKFRDFLLLRQVNNMIFLEIGDILR
jgi:hypothetical protein